MDHFATAAAAQNYQLGRPDFYYAATARVRDFLGPSEKLERALDVACGRGLSTKALLEIAHEILGTDSSEEMLSRAHPHPRIRYTPAPAERQPFPDQTFDLITICSGVRWFRIDTFLAECRRLLKGDGWLVLYDDFFSVESPSSDALKQWYEHV